MSSSNEKSQTEIIDHLENQMVDEILEAFSNDALLECSLVLDSARAYDEFDDDNVFELNPSHDNFHMFLFYVLHSKIIVIYTYELLKSMLRSMKCILSCYRSRGQSCTKASRFKTKIIIQEK